MILDTTFLIDLLRNKNKAIMKFKELLRKNIPVAITTPSIVEIWTGLIHARKIKLEREKIIDVLNSQIVLDLDRKSAIKAGEINGKLIKKGGPIGVVDSMIAGIACTNDQPILTRNVKHFGNIDKIRVETY